MGCLSANISTNAGCLSATVNRVGEGLQADIGRVGKNLIANISLVCSVNSSVTTAVFKVADGDFILADGKSFIVLVRG